MRFVKCCKIVLTHLYQLKTTFLTATFVAEVVLCLIIYVRATLADIQKHVFRLALYVMSQMGAVHKIHRVTRVLPNFWKDYALQNETNFIYAHFVLKCQNAQRH